MSSPMATLISARYGAEAAQRKSLTDSRHLFFSLALVQRRDAG